MIQVPAPPYVSLVTLGKLRNLCKLPSLQLYNWDNKISFTKFQKD